MCKRDVTKLAAVGEYRKEQINLLDEKEVWTETEREREREKDTVGERETERERDRDTKKERARDRKRYGAEKERNGETEREGDKNKEKETEREREKETERDRDRERVGMSMAQTVRPISYMYTTYTYPQSRFGHDEPGVGVWSPCKNGLPPHFTSKSWVILQSDLRPLPKDVLK